ncbi:MAG: hypothetical protein ACRDT1_12020 [Micromonosporaceae bacterium]
MGGEFADEVLQGTVVGVASCVGAHDGDAHFGDQVSVGVKGLTIPSSGRLGWFYGTDRHDEGEFFRYELTALDAIGATT